MWLGRMLGGGGVERMVVVLVSWSCLLGVQPASVDTPEPKDHDRILHGKPLSDQVSRYVDREDAWGRGVERVAMVLVFWSCLLGVQPASVDTPEPKDHDRILHGKPLSDQVSRYRYVVRQHVWGLGGGEGSGGSGVLVLPPGGSAHLCRHPRAQGSR
jgi:hypothetical protein